MQLATPCALVKFREYYLLELFYLLPFTAIQTDRVKIKYICYLVLQTQMQACFHNSFGFN